MSKRISTDTKAKIRQDMMDGLIDSEIVRKYRVSRVWVAGYRRGIQTDIESARQKARDMMTASDAERIRLITSQILELMGLSAGLIKEKLSTASPAALATIFGILTDKRQVLLGMPSTTTAIRFQTEQDMISYLKGSEAPMLTAEPVLGDPGALPEPGQVGNNNTESGADSPRADLPTGNPQDETANGES